MADKQFFDLSQESSPNKTWRAAIQKALNGDYFGMELDDLLARYLVDAAGDLLVGTAADALTRLGIGTAGQVLTVNAGATAPEWADTTSGGIDSGTSFPGSPSSGDLFFRTDLGLICYYDGTRWLTSQYTFSMPAVSRTTAGIFGTIYWVGNNYQVVIDRIACRSIVYTTNNASNYWPITLKSTNLAGTTETVYSFDTQSDTVSTYTDHDGNPSTAVPTNYGVFYWNLDAKTGSPGEIYIYPTVFYRFAIT